MGVIAIGSDQGVRTGVVERVAFGSDGCARELWVRCDDDRRRVPVTAVGVTGAQGERTLDAAVFDQAPRV